MKKYIQHYTALLIPWKSTKPTRALCLLALPCPKLRTFVDWAFTVLQPRFYNSLLLSWREVQHRLYSIRESCHSNEVPAYCSSYYTCDVSQIFRLHSTKLKLSQRATFKDNLPSHISCWFLHLNWRRAVLYHSLMPTLFSVPLGSHIYLGCTSMPGRNSGGKKVP